MTARRRLLRLRRELGGVLVARALITGVAVALAMVAACRLAGARDTERHLAAFGGAMAALLWLRPMWRAVSLERVALWVEERNPALRYAVVTLAGGDAGAAVEAQALAVPWWSMARRAFTRMLAWPAAALVASLALVAVVPARGVTDEAGRSASPARSRPGAPVADPLARVRVTITPPAYAGRPAVTAEDPTSVDALVGSLIVVTGDGDASLLVATLDSAARPVASRDGGWRVALAMPLRPALLRLRARDGRDRLLVLAPVADAAPAVTLVLPARDTVLRAASGTLLLRATLRDDIGLRDARFELVVSSGQEENFTFRQSVVAATALRGATVHALQGRVSLDSLALRAGDMLQLRAVARDANDATGPGVGSSDTRSIRVARAREYDSVSVDPAPPGEPEGQVLSQRMLITLTEALEKRRRRLARPTLLAESGRIAADQAKLRKRVGDVVFQRLGGEPLGEESNLEEKPGGRLTPEALLRAAEAATLGTTGEVMDVEGDETPILAVSKPLLEAFNAMWDAGRYLDQGETDRALPPMRRALAAIERARRAERIYLRGRPAAVVVDVARVRLAGKDKGASAEWTERVPADPVGRRRAESFAHATALLARDPSAAVDTLLVMRVQALETAPALAAALDEAARAVHRADARAIEAAWLRVRRALGPPPERHDASMPWSGAP